jgi:hypothetical protein
MFVVLASVLLLSPNNLSNAVSALLVTQQLCVMGKKGIAYMPWPWMQSLFRILSVLNWDIEVVKPGCDIPFLDYSALYLYTLMIIAIVGVVFAIGAFARAIAVDHYMRPLVYAQHEAEFVRALE